MMKFFKALDEKDRFVYLSHYPGDYFDKVYHKNKDSYKVLTDEEALKYEYVATTRGSEDAAISIVRNPLVVKAEQEATKEKRTKPDPSLTGKQPRVDMTPRIAMLDKLNKMVRR